MRLPLWPGDRFELVTSLSSAEVERRLSESIDRRWSNWLSKVGDGRFKLVPAFTVFRFNAFEPVIKGWMKQKGPDTLLVVRQVLPAYAGTFWRFWMASVLLFFAVMMWAVLSGSAQPENDAPAWLFIVVPACMLVFGYLLAGVGFWAAARHTKEHLSKVLSATEL
ncbi:MAG: hypothetical protein AAGH41_13275 [Pseudomonadota bacterium]